MAIIGILAAIVLPVYNEVKLAAKKAKDMSNLKRIADAWRECAINRGQPPKDCWTALDFACRLAEALNDPYAYISPGDKYASKVQSETMTSDAFAYAVGISSRPDDRRFSYCLLTGISPYVPLDIAIFGYTRGLCEDGTWDEKIGLYGSKGGYVVYCDGHVTWFDGSQPAKFLKWDRSGYSSNIRDVVPRDCYIGCGNGTPGNTFTNKNGSPVVLEAYGQTTYLSKNGYLYPNPNF
jgi:prepilin-type processing-associated H-X9-DG protein